MEIECFCIETWSGGEHRGYAHKRFRGNLEQALQTMNNIGVVEKTSSGYYRVQKGETFATLHLGKCTVSDSTRYWNPEWELKKEPDF